MGRRGHVGHLGVLREWAVGGGGLDGYFGEQWASRSVFEDFTEDAFQNGTAQIVRVN